MPLKTKPIDSQLESLERRGGEFTPEMVEIRYERIHVNVRIIAATNRDLKTAVANGASRQDLFY